MEDRLMADRAGGAAAVDGRARGRAGEPVLLRPTTGWRGAGTGTGIGTAPAAPGRPRRVARSFAGAGDDGETVRIEVSAPDAAGQREYRISLTAPTDARARRLLELALDRLGRAGEPAAAPRRQPGAAWRAEAAEAMADAPPDPATGSFDAGRRSA